MRKNRWALLIACVVELIAIEPKPLREVAKSHITGNVPSVEEFRPFLIRDLAAYLKPQYGEGLQIGYELLRKGPNQSGVAYPKYYLWLTFTNAQNTVVEGATRVAAIDHREFNITDFMPSSEINAEPGIVSRVFPKPLVSKILSLAKKVR
ncbi:MAG TPA: hypothetical protein VMF06_06515 [Candidatus Limnocylindria bacterium]|jgi:hypothetical protein|nr:hypothetical protein [Candidatus Limnocylindria bacterium]